MTDDEARIARWCGWRHFLGITPIWIHDEGSEIYTDPPPYLTDWRLTGELQVKLMHLNWEFLMDDKGRFFADGRDALIDDLIYADTLQAAIVAAAIAQIDSEGE